MWIDELRLPHSALEHRRPVCPYTSYLRKQGACMSQDNELLLHAPLLHDLLRCVSRQQDDTSAISPY